MATTQNTLPHDTYANQSTPLWASATAGQQFVSPSEVVNQAIPPNAEITTIVSNPVATASFQFNTIPNGTPLNEIEFAGVTDGIALKTNGEYTLVSAPNETSVLGDLNIVSKQTGGTWRFNNNELSYDNYKQLTGDATYSQLGSNTYSDSFGLNVWNVSSFNNTSTINDTNLSFYTTTGGSSNNLTYSFVSPLVPFTSSGNPDLRTANARTPIFPNDADFYAANANSVVSIVSGGSGVPYTVNSSNAGGLSAGIGARMTLANGNNFVSTQIPFWFEITMFDPVSVVYELLDEAGLFINTGGLLTQIKNVAGTLTFIPLGLVSPQSFTVGDKLRFIFEWSDTAKTIPRIIVSKNNVTLSIVTSTPVGLIRQFIPKFVTNTAVATGFNYNVVFNYGNTSPILTSFNDWEWTAGLGGLYGYNNTAIKPAASGSSPNSTTFYSIVYLQNGGEFISPPISTSLGITYTISAYYGSRFGTGSLVLTQNGNNIGSPTPPPPAWAQGTLATFVGTGSDNIRFVFTGTAGDFCSLQRINLAFNNAVDTLAGGIGKSGTSIVMGASSNFVASPDIQLTTSNISITKPINMNSNAITNTSFSGNVNTNSIAPISPATSTTIGGNLNMSNFSISNVGTLRTSNLSPISSNILVGGNFNMSNFNISNASTISTATLNASSNITTPFLNAQSIGNTLKLGNNSFQVVVENAYTIFGRSASFPLYLGMCDDINGIPAIPTGTIWIQTNFGGFRQLGIPLIPTFTRSDTLCYPLSGNNYTATQGYTIAGNSSLVVFDVGLTILEQFDNFGTTPQFYSGTQLILNTATRLYTYRVNLNAL